jgi:hypothetical protein
MAEYGEWNRKGATLSDVTARKQYGVSQDFIVKGIQAGKLEYREGSVWGNPYLRVLRRQLEAFIAEERGSAGRRVRFLREVFINSRSQVFIFSSLFGNPHSRFIQGFRKAT